MVILSHHAVCQQEGVAPTVKVTAWLSDNETSVDRIPLPLEGFAALEKSIPYPDFARRAGLEGTVCLTITIDSLGSPAKVSVRYSDAEILHDSLALAIRKCKYRPGLCKGRPIESDVTAIIDFSLPMKSSATASDLASIVELVFEHRSDTDHRADRKISLCADGSVTFSGYPLIEPIDTSHVLRIVSREPEHYYFGVVGAINPLDFDKLCVLVRRLMFTRPNTGRQRGMHHLPAESITVMCADSTRVVLTDIGNDADSWSIARAIDCIAARMQWYDRFPEPRKH